MGMAVFKKSIYKNRKQTGKYPYESQGSPGLPSALRHMKQQEVKMGSLQLERGLSLELDRARTLTSDFQSPELNSMLTTFQKEKSKSWRRMGITENFEFVLLLCNCADYSKLTPIMSDIKRT